MGRMNDKAFARKQRFMMQDRRNKVFTARRTNNANMKVKNQQNGNTLRSRGFFKVMPTDEIGKVPKCSHGPCLLFEKKNEEDASSNEYFFSCAVYRGNNELCDFKLGYDIESGKLEEKVEKETEKAEKKIKKKKTLFGYGKIPKSLSEMKPEDTVLYCEQCINVFANRHACVCAEIEKEKLKFPSTILPPLDEQNGESQFFFSDESMKVILKAVEKSNVDGVLCMGAPRIFENVRDKLPEKEGFMLDYDKRFAKFYPSKQFAQFSMLVDHFFDKNAEDKLMEFFKKCKSVVLIVDPPFGVFMEPMIQTIDKMKARFVSVGNSADSFFSIIVVPIFIRKHVLRDNFWMSDYRVTYENHKVYANRDKTMVRIFTNLASECIDLDGVDGYKFCDLCDRWVTQNNEHCRNCESCTSIEHGRFKHCWNCKKCVKPTYIHCDYCERCHLNGRCIY